jgi:hypothetical protein
LPSKRIDFDRRLKAATSGCVLTVTEAQTMNIKKPVPLLDVGVHRICPVCGKRAYSMNGIHPQCAVNQADARMKRKFDVKKKLPSVAGAEAAKGGAAFRWKKQCPKCGVYSHVRLKSCACGYRFAP